jgi:hypothetical protein
MNAGPSSVGRDRQPFVLPSTPSSDQRAVLVRRLLERGSERATPIHARPRPVGGRFPLSFLQEELWFLHQLDPDSAAYNAPSVRRLLGPLDRPALRRALDGLVARHESLRTRFPTVAGRPVQVVDPPSPMVVTEVTAIGDKRGDFLADQLRRANEKPFDFVRGPLIRASIVQVGAGEHLLHLGMHHIITDAWSDGILWRDLAVLYEAARTSTAPALPRLPIGCVEFACWQRERLTGAQLDRLSKYWRETLAGVPQLALPVSRSTGGSVSRGGRRPVEFDLSTGGHLRTLARSEQVTLFMIHLAAFAVLIHGYSGQDDFPIGTVIAGREQPDLRNVAGFLANTLVLRIRIDTSAPFLRVLKDVRQVVLGAFAHQEMPFRKLVEMLRPSRHSDRNPLFQVMFGYDPAQEDPADTYGSELAWKKVRIDLPTAKFHLSVSVGERSGRFVGVIGYRSDRFDGSVIEDMADRWRALLDRLVANPDEAVIRMLRAVGLPPARPWSSDIDHGSACRRGRGSHRRSTETMPARPEHNGSLCLPPDEDDQGA